MRRLAPIIFVVLALTGGAILAVAALVGGRPLFEGELRIPLGQSEQVVVGPLGEGGRALEGGFEPAPEALLGEAIPFESGEVARNWLDPNAYYTVVRLPHPIGLTNVEVLSQGEASSTLTVRGFDGEMQAEVVRGQNVGLGDTSFVFDDIRKWAGLLADPKGDRLAAIALRGQDGTWSPPLFLGHGTWMRTGTGLAVYARWCDGKDDAFAVPDTSPRESPRWGIADGDTVQWFSSFLPGTGAVLADGRAVTLLRSVKDEEGAPHLVVRIEQEGRTTEAEVAANGTSPDGTVHLHNPAPAEELLELRIWRDGAALVVARREGKPVAQREMATDEEWAPPGFSHAIRLEDVLERAIVVEEANSPFHEVVLCQSEEGLEDGRVGEDSPHQAGGGLSPTPRRVCVREGELTRCGDLLVRFTHHVRPPTLRYDLSIDTTPPIRFALERGSMHTMDGWVLSQGTPDIRMPDVAVLTAAYHVRSGLAAPAAALLLVGTAGFGGWCWAVWRRSGRRGRA